LHGDLDCCDFVPIPDESSEPRECGQGVQSLSCYDRSHLIEPCDALKNGFPKIIDGEEAPMNLFSHAKSECLSLRGASPASARAMSTGRPSVVQGFFQAQSRARFADLRQRMVQAKPAVGLRAGVEAFPVSLAPNSGGWPLPRDIQAKMERALGASFSDVRVHVGPQAAAIGAVAFTWGTNIHFAPGQYNPHTSQGQILLGHELVHVVQQKAGRVTNPFGDGVAVVQDDHLEAEADRLGRQAAMFSFNSTVQDTAPDRELLWHAPIGAQGTAVNRKSAWPNLAQRAGGAMAPGQQTGISPSFKPLSLETRAAAPIHAVLQRKSSVIQCIVTTVFAVNHGTDNINPHYDDVHITRLEDGEINNPANLPHLARAGELMHLTFRSTANNGHVVHWFYNGASWREHKYNSSCPAPATGNTQALQQKAIRFAYGPSLADYVVTKPAKKRGRGRAVGSGSPSLPAPVASSSTQTLPPPPLAASAAPLPRFQTTASQNLPWRWDEEYGLGTAPTAVHLPAPIPALRVAPALAVGPAGLNAAADPVVPGFGRGGSPFGPVGPSGLNAAADPVVPGFGRGASPFGPIGPPRRT
jgi:hypothetical protein